MIDSYQFKKSLIESMLLLVQRKDLAEEDRKAIISKVIEAISMYHSTGFIDNSKGNSDEMQILSNRLFSLLTKDKA